MSTVWWSWERRFCSVRLNFFLQLVEESTSAQVERAPGLAAVTVPLVAIVAYSTIRFDVGRSLPTPVVEPLLELVDEPVDTSGDALLDFRGPTQGGQAVDLECALLIFPFFP